MEILYSIQTVVHINRLTLIFVTFEKLHIIKPYQATFFFKFDCMNIPIYSISLISFSVLNRGKQTVKIKVANNSAKN